MKNTKIKLVEQLLDLATKDHRFPNTGDRMLYERGYLTGLLAAIIADDFYAETYIKRRIKQLENKQK
jgi:hypothetical protein